MFRLIPASWDHPGIHDLLSESLLRSPTPRPASKAARFYSSTRIFDEKSSMATNLQCRAIPSTAEVEVTTPAPALRTWLKAPTKTPKPHNPAFNISGAWGKRTTSSRSSPLPNAPPTHGRLTRPQGNVPNTSPGSGQPRKNGTPQSRSRRQAVPVRLPHKGDPPRHTGVEQQYPHVPGQGRLG